MKQTSTRNQPILNSWSVRMVESTLQRYKLKDALWLYEHGLLVMAIQKVGETTGQERYIRFVSDWIDTFVQEDGAIRTYWIDDTTWIRSIRASCFLAPGREPGLSDIERLSTCCANK